MAVLAIRTERGPQRDSSSADLLTAMLSSDTRVDVPSTHACGQCGAGHVEIGPVSETRMVRDLPKGQRLVVGDCLDGQHLKMFADCRRELRWSPVGYNVACRQAGAMDDMLPYVVQVLRHAAFLHIHCYWPACCQGCSNAWDSVHYADDASWRQGLAACCKFELIFAAAILVEPCIQCLTQTPAVSE